MDMSRLVCLQDIERPYKTKSSEKLSLYNIALNISQGEVIAIMGDADSGKNTLLRCINLLERPLTGIVAIDNKNLMALTKQNLHQARKMISYIDQNTNILTNKTIFNNLALPLIIQKISSSEIKKRVLAILKYFDLEDIAANYPNQLNLNNLIKIKIIMARAMITHPKILLCNDINDVDLNADLKTSYNIANLLKKINKDFNLAIILVTNNIEIIKTTCHKVISMHQGSIIEQCSTIEFLTNPQHPITKDLIKLIARQELPIIFKRIIRNQPQKGLYPIIRIAFTNNLPAEAVLSDIIQAYHVKINIIQAYQESIQGQLLKIILIDIKGNSNDINKTLQHLTNHQLYSEILGYVPNTN